jgi:DNA repair protein RadD
MFTETTASTVVLRPYQVDALRRFRERVDAGTRRILMVAPTGAGKATLAAQIILEAVGAGWRALFLAHRRELIVQAYERILRMGVPEALAGVLMGGDRRRRPQAPVQVASVDTLRHRAKPQAELVILDECHRALAKTNRDIAGAYPDALHVGFTATPYRADGKGLRDAYDELIVVASPRELMALGFLVEPRVFTVPQSKLPDLSSVKIKRGDYDSKALAQAVDRSALVGNIVEHWQEHASDLRTVVFAASIEHSKHIAERFREAGIAAEHLDGTMSFEERDAILGRLESGETRVVSNVNVLTEGWDQPTVKCAILARPTKSTGLCLQEAGRILRPWNDTRAIILDHAGCVLEHGLPQDDREFSLDPPPKKKSKGPLLRPCPECFAVLPISSRICPECGELLREDEPERQAPSEASGRLEEITVSPLDDARSVWAKLCQTALERGYKPGWAYLQFRERFGRSVPKWFPPPRERTEEDKRTRLGELLSSERSAGWAKLKYRLEFGEAPPEA